MALFKLLCLNKEFVDFVASYDSRLQESFLFETMTTM